MKLSAILVSLSATAALAAAPQNEVQTWNTCLRPMKRKEWRNLNALEKLNFIGSVKCLMNKPSKLQSTYPASTSRFEDFLSIHQGYTPRTHYVGQFLPWHRAFLQEYENALRSECGYRGALPYWDAHLDFANFTASPVFSTTLGFGGNGVGDVVPPPGGPSSTGNCIADGPFKNMRVHISQGATPAVATDRCLLRYFRPDYAAYWYNGGKLAELMTTTTFETFSPKLEGDLGPGGFDIIGLHSSGHSSVGGDMSDMWTSPSDPLFYVFHANIDRIWANWQKANPGERQYDIGLPIKPRGPLNLWPEAPEGDATLDYVLEPLKVGTAANLKVGQVMNTKGKGVPPASGKPAGILCYEYE